MPIDELLMSMMAKYFEIYILSLSDFSGAVPCVECAKRGGSERLEFIGTQEEAWLRCGPLLKLCFELHLM